MSIGPTSMLEVELSRLYEEAEALKPEAESFMKTCPDADMREALALNARLIAKNNALLAAMAQRLYGISNPFSVERE